MSTRRITAVALLVCSTAVSVVAAGLDLAGDASAGIEANADRIEFARAKSLLVAKGHVVLKSGARQLTADSVTYKVNTREAWANGNVVFVQTNNTWTGDRLYCNMATGEIIGEGKSKLTAEPFQGFLQQFRRTETSVIGKDALITSCTNSYQDWHYNIKAASAEIDEGKSITARHVWFYLAGFPLLYVPYWHRATDGSGLGLRPGYSTTMGAYLLAAYEYRINDYLRGITHLDYRARRGVATGQDLEWLDGSTNQSWSGTLKTYYADDKDPLADRDQNADIDNSRYRLQLRHDQQLTSRTRLLVKASFLSDGYILDDFFRPEYRVEPQPENYATLTYRGEDFMAGLSIRPRLNTFYETVSRIPEGYIEFPLQSLGKTPFDYESRTVAGRLERLWDDTSTNESYSAIRVDTRHVVSITRKVGFLNVVPRVAYEGTYYSGTPADTSSNQDGGSVVRSAFEAGVMVSFKMFKIWMQADENREGLRHVVEPYLNETFRPDPNVLPEELYGFDSIDRVEGGHVLRLGVRNKFQVKRDGRPHDIIDINTWSDGNLDPDYDGKVFEDIGMDARFRLLSTLSIDCDGRFALDGAATRELNTHLVWGSAEKTYADFEYRRRYEKSSLLAGRFAHSPSDKWTFTYETRYEFEESRLEEQSFWVQRNYDCMCVALGFSQIPGYTTSDGSVRDNEYQVLFKLWLRAFPEIGFSVE